MGSALTRHAAGEEGQTHSPDPLPAPGGGSRTEVRPLLQQTSVITSLEPPLLHSRTLLLSLIALVTTRPSVIYYSVNFKFTYYFRLFVYSVSPPWNIGSRRVGL